MEKKEENEGEKQTFKPKKTWLLPQRTAPPAGCVWVLVWGRRVSGWNSLAVDTVGLKQTFYRIQTSFRIQIYKEIFGRKN